MKHRFVITKEGDLLRYHRLPFLKLRSRFPEHISSSAKEVVRAACWKGSKIVIASEKPFKGSKPLVRISPSSWQLEDRNIIRLCPESMQRYFRSAEVIHIKFK